VGICKLNRSEPNFRKSHSPQYPFPNFDNKKFFWASLTRQQQQQLHHLKIKQRQKREERKKIEKRKTFVPAKRNFPKGKTLSRSLLPNDTTISASASSSAAGATATDNSAATSADRERPRPLRRLPNDPHSRAWPHGVRLPYLPNAADASAGAHA